MYLWICVCFHGFQHSCVPLFVLSECCTVSQILVAFCPFSYISVSLVSVLYAYVNQCPNVCRPQYLLKQVLSQRVCTSQCMEYQICLSLCQILHIPLLFTLVSICPNCSRVPESAFGFLVCLCLFVLVSTCHNFYMLPCLCVLMTIYPSVCMVCFSFWALSLCVPVSEGYNICISAFVSWYLCAPAFVGFYFCLLVSVSYCLSSLLITFLRMSAHSSVYIRNIYWYLWITTFLYPNVPKFKFLSLSLTMSQCLCVPVSLGVTESVLSVYLSQRLCGTVSVSHHL